MKKRKDAPVAAKGDSAGNKNRSSGSNQGRVLQIVGLAGLVFVCLAALQFFTSDNSVASDTGRGASAKQPAAAFSSPTTQTLLEQFTQDHKEGLLWGTFRPGIMFGVKSRTQPESVVAGLMWSSVSADGKALQEGKIRHTCEESDTKEGLKFGYSEHDGSSYGKQVITDPVHNMQMTTTFIKKEHDSWTMRVSGSVTPSKSKKPKEGSKVLLFYLGVDSEFSQGSDAKLEIEQQAREGKLAVIKGSTPQLGDFRLVAVPSKDSAHAVDGQDVVAWAMPDNTAIVDVKATLVQQLKGAGADDNARAMILRPGQASASSTKSVVMLQLIVQKEFDVDFIFESGSSLKASSNEAITSEAWLGKKQSVTQLIEARSDTFNKHFEEVFKMQQSGKFDEEQIKFAQAAMSASIGGLGYFYGQSKVKEEGSDAEHLLPPRPLFTSVPSRSFFPRGFLWDEGFHQLLIGRWNPAIARDVIAHWFSMMHEDGWIPREQILGAEAVAKVPDWAVAQHRTHANPPTFLLAIESLLEYSPDAATNEWLKAIFPALEQWFSWFRTTQAGDEAGTFRWRGRNAKDGKLNAMTLGSGLDDYPRASKVSNSERHVDLYSWMAHGAGVLARVGKRAGLAAEKIAEHQKMHEDMVASLDTFHWDEKRKRYCDYGLHANQGSYGKHIVVKCGNDDDGSSIEHAIAPQLWEKLQKGATNTPPCPISHPKFMFPLGDGQGGLMTREVFVPKNEKNQFVDHTGYVSLFPFLLRLIPADSPKLGDVLETIGDDKKGLWSDYGLRSMAPSDKMYLRENAPGDAPYWRGPIWINCNFLAVKALRYYAEVEGPHQQKAAELLANLSHNLITNLFQNFKKTGFFWEQYNPKDGKGQRTHPFNGWSSLVVLMMS